MATRYEMTADDLARAVFLQNARDGRIHLDFPSGPTDARGAFNFLLDLFLKGLVLLYGGAEGRVDVGHLDEAQFARAAERMRHMGVLVRLQAVPAPTSLREDADARADAEAMLREAGAALGAPMERGARLEDLSFTVRSGDAVVRISFQIIL